MIILSRAQRSETQPGIKQMFHFSNAKIDAAADLAMHNAAMGATLAAIPVAADPTLYERCIATQDRLVTETRKGRGRILDARDQVTFDNLVLDRLDRRRDRQTNVRAARKAVQRLKNAFLEA